MILVSLVLHLGFFRTHILVEMIKHTKHTLCFILQSAAAGPKKHDDPGKNMVFLRESCQIVRPVTYSEMPEDCKQKMMAGGGPTNVTAYLEVVDLLDQMLRYIPVPEPATSSNYASWYTRQLFLCFVLFRREILHFQNHYVHLY